MLIKTEYKIQPIESILYNKDFYNQNNTSPSDCQVKNKNKVINKMNFLCTSDQITRDWLEKNNFKLIQVQETESGKIYVFENKPSEKFDKSLGLQIHYSNKLRF